MPVAIGLLTAASCARTSGERLIRGLSGGEVGEVFVEGAEGAVVQRLLCRGAESPQTGSAGAVRSLLQKGRGLGGVGSTRWGGSRCAARWWQGRPGSRRVVAARSWRSDRARRSACPGLRCSHRLAAGRGRWRWRAGDVGRSRSDGRGHDRSALTNAGTIRFERLCQTVLGIPAARVHDPVSPVRRRRPRPDRRQRVVPLNFRPATSGTADPPASASGLTRPVDDQASLGAYAGRVSCRRRHLASS